MQILSAAPMAGDASCGPGQYFAIVSVNAGLNGNTLLEGKTQQYHLGQIEALVENAVSKPDVLGVTFCEVGDSFSGLRERERQLFAASIKNGFKRAQKKLEPNIFFAPADTTVAAICGEIRVANHGTFTQLSTKDPRRGAQWIDIIGPGSSAIRLVISHQPSSEQNPYPLGCRRAVCQGILRRAAGALTGQDGSLAEPPSQILATGNLNLSRHQVADYGHGSGFDGRIQLCYVSRRQAENGVMPVGHRKSEDDGQRWQKHGDLAILVGCEGVQLDSWVRSITEAHDVVVAAWAREATPLDTFLNVPDNVKRLRKLALSCRTHKESSKLSWEDQMEEEDEDRRSKSNSSSPRSLSFIPEWGRPCESDDEHEEVQVVEPGTWPSNSIADDGAEHASRLSSAATSAAEHPPQLIRVTEQYELLDWLARTMSQRHRQEIQERMFLRDQAARALRFLTMTTEEKDLLDRFLQTFFWKRPRGFCQRLPDGHGMAAATLRSSVDLISLLKTIMDIRQACLTAMYPDVCCRDLLLQEIDEDESTACYRHMFAEWYADDKHWREDQMDIYTRGAHFWKPFNAYLKRVFGGKHLVLALFQVGLSWLPDHEDGRTPQDALKRFLGLLSRVLEAKQAHDAHAEVEQARADSGLKKGHSFRRTARGDLRDDRKRALLALLRGLTLHNAMSAALAADAAVGKHWRRNWDSDALDLWSDWNARQRRAWHEYGNGALVSRYVRLKTQYYEQYTPARAKKFRMGPPGRL